MKACFTIIILLFYAFQASAQVNFNHQLRPESQQGFKNQVINSADSCQAPYNLYSQFSPIGNDQYMIYLAWGMDKPDDSWIGWDDGVHFSGVGSGSWTVAARWDSTQLLTYQDYHLKRMRIILNDMSAHTVIFQVWNGMNNSHMIYQDTIFEYDDGVWVNHDFNTDLYIDSSKELLIGYTAISVAGGNFPFGTDNGPAIAGYGDKITTDGTTWDNLSDFGLDYNWNIQFYVEDSAGNEKQVGHKSTRNFLYLSGFNVYESVNGGDFVFMEYFPYAPDTNYLGFQIDAHPYERCYKLTAVWTNPVDTCESLPATTKNNPEQDYVCFWLVGEAENDFKNHSWAKCQPNPFSTSTTIEYQLDHPSLATLSVFNHYGELVYKIQEHQQPGNQHFIWDSEGLPAGFYTYRMETEGKYAKGKLIKIRN